MQAYLAARVALMPRPSRKVELCLKALAIIGLVIVFEKDCYGTVIK